MPRPPRRGATQARPAVTTTPTRPQTNAITAAIPPFMLETPPHAPFATTPIPPSNNPGESIVPNIRSRLAQARSTAHQTPTNNVANQDPSLDQSQVSTNAHGSTLSDQANDEQSFLESMQHTVEDTKQLQGLREISSLATWTLSSAKPGCGLPQLRHPGTTQFWQSDGPQPHTLTLHFFKLVAIVKMRIYLDFDLDESYTPTKMKFFAGMSEGGLVEFGSWEAVETTDPDTGETHSSVETMRGWLDISLQGVGGRETSRYVHDLDPLGEGQDGSMRDVADEGEDTDLVGGDVLKAMVVQIQICENHQNGKDTHVRGFQVYARDDSGTKELREVVKRAKGRRSVMTDEKLDEAEYVGLQPAEWMGDPEIR